MKRFTIIFIVFFFSVNTKAQNLNLNDLLKIYNMNFEQIDEFLTFKNYILDGKDVQDYSNSNNTSTIWYAGVNETGSSKYSTLLNNHWSVYIKYINKEREHVSYESYSKQNFLDIKKQLLGAGYKLVKSETLKNQTISRYEGKTYNIILGIIKQFGSSNEYVGDSYIITFFKK